MSLQMSPSRPLNLLRALAREKVNCCAGVQKSLDKGGMKKGLEMGSHDQRWTEVTGQNEVLEQIFRLRVTAWRQQVALPGAMREWRDSVDDKARHWAVLHQRQPIAAVRLSLHRSVSELPHAEVFADLVAAKTWSTPIAYCARGIVHPEYRRRGLWLAGNLICIDAAKKMWAGGMVALSGSLDSNRFVTEALIDIGYQLIGKGQPYGEIPYQATAAPTVLFHRLNDKSTSTVCDHDRQEK